MLATVRSATVLGIEGCPVTVEVHTGQGLPSFSIVGLPDASCREARDRCRAAVLSAGLLWPDQKTIVNLAPSAERKVGTGLDLAIALGVLVASDQLPAPAMKDLACIGELGRRQQPARYAKPPDTLVMVAPASGGPSGESGLGSTSPR